MITEATYAERAFLPLRAHEIEPMRRRLRAAGHSRTLAAGVLEWLMALTAGQVDALSPTTVAKYRHVLWSLPAAPHGPLRGGGGGWGVPPLGVSCGGGPRGRGVVSGE